jgi:thioredoxin 1
MDLHYDQPEPRRDEVDSWPGPSVLEFGADWCGICQGAQPLITAALAQFPSVRHRKVGDGKGKPLGRSFRVKLWPTLIFLKDGQEVARAVRPGDAEEIERCLVAAGGVKIQ